MSQQPAAQLHRRKTGVVDESKRLETDGKRVGGGAAPGGHLTERSAAGNRLGRWVDAGEHLIRTLDVNSMSGRP